jgi:hypothetical protein
LVDEAENVLAELIFELSDRELNWAESLALAHSMYKAVEKMIDDYISLEPDNTK